MIQFTKYLKNESTNLRAVCKATISEKVLNERKSIKKWTRVCGMINIKTK